MPRKGQKQTEAGKEAGAANLAKWRTENPPGALKHGLYRSLDHVDGRTRLGKAIRELKAALREYAGHPTTATEMLIPHLVFMHIRLSMFEAATIDDPVESKLADHFLPMVGRFKNSLETLQKLAGQPKTVNLDDYIAATYEKDKG